MARTLRAKRALGFAALVLAGVACVPPVTRTPLSDAHRKAIGSVRVVANVGDDVLSASYEQSDAASIAVGSQFGLLGAILGAAIDSAITEHRASTAAEAIGPVKQVLSGFDSRPLVEASFRRELGKIDDLQLAKIELLQEPWLGRTRVAALLDEGGGDAVLVADIQYRLSLSGDHLVVIARVALFPTKAASSDELRAIARAPSIDDFQPCPALYRNVFLTSLPRPASTANEGWTLDGGAAARWAIEGGLAEIARMLAWDLEHGGPASGSLYAEPGVKPVVRKDLGLAAAQWYPTSTESGRIWLRAQSGELASTGDSYPGFDGSAAARFKPARVEEPEAPAAAELPDPVPGGGLAFSFASGRHTRQGGSVTPVAYSERAGDAVFYEKPAVMDGQLRLSGQLGFRKGSSWAMLGAVWDLQPRSVPFDASRFRSVTFRLASTTRVLRLRMIGSEKAAAEKGCYPVFFQDVTEDPTDYTIPLSKFVPEGHCGAKSKEIEETLPALVAFEVSSNRITDRPVVIWVGPTTLRP